MIVCNSDLKVGYKEVVRQMGVVPRKVRVFLFQILTFPRRSRYQEYGHGRRWGRFKEPCGLLEQDLCLCVVYMWGTGNHASTYGN